MSVDLYNHLWQLFVRLVEHGLVVKMVKYEFEKPTLEFLGHCLDKHGASPLPSKMQAVVEFPAPDTVKGLQEFLSIVTYYHHFLPCITATLKPLFPATATKSKHIQWTDLMHQSFLDTKTALTQAVMLSHPEADAPIQLTVDASDIMVGAEYEEDIQSKWKPIAFFSRHLHQSERKYSTFNRIVGCVPGNM